MAAVRPSTSHTPTRNPSDQYLRLIGHTYYVRVKVPPSLAKTVGNTHIVRSLKTGDKARANRLKHALVASIKAEFDRLREGRDSGLLKPTHVFADAAKLREDLREAKAQQDHTLEEALEDEAVRIAESIEALQGFTKAKKWHRQATVLGETLAELHEKWLEAHTFRESTNSAHRKALSDLLTYIGVADAHPEDIDRKGVLRFIESYLAGKGLAYATARDRLVSLGGFWNYIEGRGTVPKDSNPFSGHKLSRKTFESRETALRPFTDAELVSLLQSVPATSRRRTLSYLGDVSILGLFTGCRLEELCSLTVRQVEKGQSPCAAGAPPVPHAILHITDSKTKAGIRPVGVTAPAALAVLARRIKEKHGDAALFGELTAGGADNKLSYSATKAFTRYRRSCGVPDDANFHSFRRGVVTVLERAEVTERSIARFVGHKIGTMAGDTYSAGANAAQSLETSRAIRFPEAVEKAALALANNR